MNERIEKLALQAGMKTTSLHYGRKDPYVLWEDDIETFAELIVRECAVELMKLGNAYSESEEDAEYMQGLLDGADIIKEHFGVTE